MERKLLRRMAEMLQMEEKILSTANGKLKMANKMLLMNAKEIDDV